MENKLMHISPVRLIPLAILFFAPLLADAQRAFNFSAPEAVQFALKNVTDIRNLKIDRDKQKAQNAEITGQALPQINGNISMQHFFSIPVTLLPDFVTPQVYNVLVDEGVQDGNGQPIVKPDKPAQFFPARFGVPWQASAGFTFQQLLFQPDVFVGLQARSTALKFADFNIKVMEDSVRSNVYRAYYSVLIAEKRRVYLEESIQRLEKLSIDQNALFKAGFAEKLDIERTEVNLNNLKTSKTQLDNLIYIGYASLKFSMGLNQRDTLTLKDSLSVDFVKKDILESTGFRYEDRSEVQLLNTAKELQQLNVRRFKLTYAPTVSAFWNFSGNALRSQFDFFDFSKPWYQTSVAGVNVGVPIFDGLQRHNRIKQAKLELDKTANNMENLERVIDLQREAAVTVFRNSLVALDAQERNLQLAEKVFNTTKKKYEQGLGSSFEVLQSDTDLQTAQSNFFQALYDAVTAKIAYYRSLGKLQ